jgi:hypothetical protein
VDGDAMFTIVPIIIGTGFILVFALITVAIVKSLIVWNRNNNSPLLTVPAVVVGKRGHHSSGTADTPASTTCHATFEIQGGERLEFQLSGSQYGLLSERDRGGLSYQGTRYKGFNRTPQDR